MNRLLAIIYRVTSDLSSCLFPPVLSDFLSLSSSLCLVFFFLLDRKAPRVARCILVVGSKDKIRYRTNQLLCKQRQKIHLKQNPTITYY